MLFMEPFLSLFIDAVKLSFSSLSLSLFEEFSYSVTSAASYEISSGSHGLMSSVAYLKTSTSFT